RSRVPSNLDRIPQGDPELARHLSPPAQRVVDLGREIAARLPRELSPGLGDVADQLGRISRAARSHSVRHGAAGNAGGFGHRLLYAVARATAEIERFVQPSYRHALQPAERPHMRIGKIA